MVRCTMDSRGKTGKKGSEPQVEKLCPDSLSQIASEIEMALSRKLERAAVVRAGVSHFGCRMTAACSCSLCSCPLAPNMVLEPPSQGQSCRVFLPRTGRQMRTKVSHAGLPQRRLCAT